MFSEVPSVMEIDNNKTPHEIGLNDPYEDDDFNIHFDRA